MTTAAATAQIVECLKRNDLAAAQAACQQAQAQTAEDPQVWHLSGIVAAQCGQAEQAVKCFERAIARRPTAAVYHYNLGLALSGLGDLSQAAAAYRRAVELQPKFLEAQNNLANALMRQGDNPAALEAFEQLVQQFPDNADAHYNLANLLQDIGESQRAVEHYRHALQLQPQHSAARENLGRAYSEAGDVAQAQQVWQEWLEREPEHPIARHMVAATGGDAPRLERCAEDYVREAFNRDFARSFDHQLARLDYHAPQLVVQALQAAAPNLADAEVLDAGCGTGLCGPLLRAAAARLSGVDLSAAMLEEAAKREVYDHLIEADLVAYLAAHPDQFDVIVSADTLCYFGDLAPVLTAAAGGLRSGGWLVFTVELAKADEADHGPEYQLQPNGRFCHHEAYVRRAITQAGLGVIDMAPATLRKERGQPVAGLVVTAVPQSASLALE